MNADLDALAAYVASLSTFANSPHRNADGSLTAAAVAGREVFRAANCASCHGGRVVHRQRGREPHECRHDQAASGKPPRRTADRPRCADAARRVGNGAVPARRLRADDRGRGHGAHAGVSLSATDLANLVAYVEQIGGQETSAPLPNNPPVVTNPGNRSGYTGVAVSLAIAASDADGEALTFSATGLPAGLSINSATGVITGTPGTAGNYTVTVTARDALASASRNSRGASRCATPPCRRSPPTWLRRRRQRLSSAHWSASTDNVGVAGYIIYRSTNGTQGAEVARTTAACAVDRPGIPGEGEVHLLVKAYDAAGNLSALTALRSVTPSEAPTPPSLSVALSNGKPRLTWTASTDNVGVAGYIVYRSTSGGNGSEIARDQRADSGLTASAVARETYSYNVRAYDAAGNLSARSTRVTIVAQ